MSGLDGVCGLAEGCGRVDSFCGGSAAGERAFVVTQVSKTRRPGAPRVGGGTGNPEMRATCRRSREGEASYAG